MRLVEGLAAGYVAGVGTCVFVLAVAYRKARRALTERAKPRV